MTAAGTADATVAPRSARDAPPTPPEAAGWRPHSALVIGCGRLESELAAGLQARGVRSFLCAEVGKGLHLLRTVRPDLLVTSPSLDEPVPFGFLHEASRAGADTVCLFLLSGGSPEGAARALESGADDVVAPPHSASAILLRAFVARARRARAHVGPSRSWLSVGDLRVDLWSRTVVRGSRTVRLSPRETQLLRLLVEAGGRVVPLENLVREIWGAGSAGEDALYATMSRLRRRLGDYGAEPRLLLSIRGVGYRLALGEDRDAEERDRGPVPPL